jgi:hypothetical protein
MATRKLPPDNSVWSARLVPIAARMCSLGATDRDLAESFGCSVSTINQWKLDHEEFSAALNIGKEVPDTRVERSLLNRALGYTYEAVKIVTVDGAPCSVKYTEHVPPDVVACIFWLKNRKPDQWRDKLDINATVRPCDVSANPLSLDEWDRKYGVGSRTAS